MKLISSADTLAFLSQAAPRPWVERMLRWMIFDRELTAYSVKGIVQPSAPAGQFIIDLVHETRETKGPLLEAAIRQKFPADFAEKLVGKTVQDRVYEQGYEWDDTDAPETIDAGFFMFATELDWDKGTLWAEWIPGDKDILDLFFPNEEMMASEYQNAQFEARFTGLKFQLKQIEMLLPNFHMPTASIVLNDRAEKNRSVGRPVKWNWEGALAFVVAQAQKPDGLPTGPGAQARIEEMISSWFIDEAGDSPSTSLVRQRAAAITRSLERPETPKKHY